MAAVAPVERNPNGDEAKMVVDLKLEEKVKNMDPKHVELFTAVEKG